MNRLDQMLRVFRHALEDCNGLAEHTITFTVDHKFINGFVLDPNTEVESEPLINCKVDGQVLNFRLSAFSESAEPVLEQGVFLLRDEDGVVHGIRFYLMTKLLYGGRK